MDVTFDEASTEGYYEDAARCPNGEFGSKAATPSVKDTGHDAVLEVPLDAEQHCNYGKVTGTYPFHAELHPETMFSLKERGRQLHRPSLKDKQLSSDTRGTLTAPRTTS